MMADQPTAAKPLQTSLAPMLSVRNGAKAVEFYKAAFGATELFRVEDRPAVRSSPSYRSASPNSGSPTSRPSTRTSVPKLSAGATVRLVLVVDDPDAVFAQAVAAGATVVWPVADQPYGWRVGRVVDPFGHHWEIGKPLAGDIRENSQTRPWLFTAAHNDCTRNLSGLALPNSIS